MGLRYLGENSGQSRCLSYRLTHDEGECSVVELVYQPQVVTLPIGHEVRRVALLAASVRSWGQHRAGGEDTIRCYLVGACQIGNFPRTVKSGNGARLIVCPNTCPEAGNMDSSLEASSFSPSEVTANEVSREV